MEALTDDTVGEAPRHDRIEVTLAEVHAISPDGERHVETVVDDDADAPCRRRGRDRGRRRSHLLAGTRGQVSLDAGGGALFVM